MMPKISVIVPVYRAEEFLTQCIESILAQTFTDFELILVDDGSPDHSGAICDNYAEKDPRVRVIHQQNSGVSTARNAALAIAQGTYIMFCDSDDWVEPEWCQRLYEAIQAPNVVMAVCGHREWDRDCVVRTIGFEQSEEIIKLSELFGKPFPGAPWDKIYIREQIEKHALRFPVDISYGEDFRFILEYLGTFDGDKKIFFFSEALNNYRIVEGSLSHKCIKDYWKWEKETIKLRLEVAAIHNTNFQNCQEILNYYYYRLFYYSIKHLFSPENDMAYLKKYKNLKEIIKSQEFVNMQKSKQYKSFPLWYRFLLEKRIVLLLFIYHIWRG